MSKNGLPWIILDNLNYFFTWTWKVISGSSRLQSRQGAMVKQNTVARHQWWHNKWNYLCGSCTLSRNGFIVSLSHFNKTSKIKVNLNASRLLIWVKISVWRLNMQLLPHFNEPNFSRHSIEVKTLNPEPISDANFLGNCSRTFCSLNLYWTISSVQWKWSKFNFKIISIHSYFCFYSTHIYGVPEVWYSKNLWFKETIIIYKMLMSNNLFNLTRTQVTTQNGHN